MFALDFTLLRPAGICFCTGIELEGDAGGRSYSLNFHCHGFSVLDMLKRRR